MSWRENYEKKMMSIEDAAKLINSNDNAWIGWFTCLPYTLVDAIADRKDELQEVNLVGALLAKPLKCMESADYIGKVNFHSIFAGPAERQFEKIGNVHVNSVTFAKSNVPIRDFYKVNVLITEASEPDEEGYVYFGPQGTAWGGQVLDYAEKVIVCINKFQPKTVGTYNKVHVDKVDAFCRDDHALYELKQPPVREIDEKIASYIIPLIPDGATIQVGLGGIANAVAYGLKDRKNLGVHTEMLTDSLVEMAKQGVINQKILAGFGFGSQAVYDFIGEGKCELAPISEVNTPSYAAEHDDFISINSCLMVDLTGQVGSESIGFKQFSSTGGQLDYVLAANFSKGGKSFLCLNSTVKGKDGNPESTINVTLPKGQAITTPRSMVMYVVTEYGIVDIAYKPLEERVRLLISIAHPDFRERLTQEAKAVGLLK